MLIIPYHKHLSLLPTVVLVLTLSACSHQLTRPNAAQLIKGDPAWSKPITIPVKVGGITYYATDVSFQKKLQSLGYVEVQGPLVGHYYSYTVRMTPKGDEVIRTGGWTLVPTGEKAYWGGGPAPAPTPQTLTIPLGVARLVDVTGIVGDDKTATAEFTFQLDCNDIAKELGCATVIKSAKRTFTRYDDGWRLDPVK